MTRKALIIFAVALATLTACRTTEANYRAAYEKAVAARDADADIADQQLQPKYVVEQGDTIFVTVENVSVVNVEGATPQLKAFSTVAAKFRQRFNATSMCRRLIDNGYDQSFVVTTPSGEYYVIVASYTSAREAKKMAERLSTDQPVTLSKGMPFILRDPRKR